MFLMLQLFAVIAVFMPSKSEYILVDDNPTGMCRGTGWDAAFVGYGTQAYCEEECNLDTACTSYDIDIRSDGTYECFKFFHTDITATTGDANGCYKKIDSIEYECGAVDIDGYMEHCSLVFDKSQSDRIAEDNVLQGNIDGEELARIAADEALAAKDAELQANIAGEAAARTAADAELAANDAVLQGNIDGEEGARISADGELQGNIDNEESSRISADDQLQGNIDSEISDRISANDELQASIDDIYSTLADIRNLPQTAESIYGYNYDNNNNSLFDTINPNKDIIIIMLVLLNIFIITVGCVIYCNSNTKNQYAKVSPFTDDENQILQSM